MWALTVIVAAFALALIVSSLLFGVGILAVPIALVAVAIIALLELGRRRARRAGETNVDFTRRDRETLAPDPPRSPTR